MTVVNGGGAVGVARTENVVIATGVLPASNPEPQSALSCYFLKWRGNNESSLPREPLKNVLVSWTGAFISILVVAVLNQYAGPKMDFDWLIASFGASAVLMFGIPAAKLSQPRNVIGGHTLSALVGIIVRLILQPQYGDGRADFVSTALGMSLSLSAMQATGTTHPPAGATGLLAAAADPIADWHGFKFLLTAAAGSSVMVVVALLFNNLVPGRTYPTFW